MEFLQQNELHKTFNRFNYINTQTVYGDYGLRSIKSILQNPHKYQQLQLNTGYHFNAIIMDIDNEELLTEWQFQGLPTPTIQTVNKHNNKAHLVWLLRVPIWKEHKHAVAYYKAIVNSIKIIIQADPDYQNHWTKNFLNTDIYRVTYNDLVYELGDFREFIISSFEREAIKESLEYDSFKHLTAGSRHIHLFEVLRRYGYKTVWEPNFRERLTKRAEEINTGFQNPIKVKYIVKSIYNFCWENRHKFKPQKNRHAMGFNKIQNLSPSDFKIELKSRQIQSANRTISIKNLKKAGKIKVAIDHLLRNKIPLTHKNIAEQTKYSLRTIQRSVQIVQLFIGKFDCDIRSIRLIPVKADQGVLMSEIEKKVIVIEVYYHDSC